MDCIDTFKDPVAQSQIVHCLHVTSTLRLAMTVLDNKLRDFMLRVQDNRVASFFRKGSLA